MKRVVTMAALFGLLVVGLLGVLQKPGVVPATALTSLNTGDTAWMLTATGLVMLMTPGLSFFYGGMVRGKNVISTMLQSFIALAVLANPIASQMAVMRSNLFGGLVSNLITNLKRKQSRVRLFEVGRTFHRDAAAQPVNGFRQPWKLAGLAFGGALPEGWAGGSRKVDFYDVKGDVEALLAPAHLRFEKLAHPALHPGRAARVLLDGQDIGCIGELHREWVQKYDLPNPPVLFELDFSAVKLAQVPAYAEVSKFPPVIGTRPGAVAGVGQPLPVGGW